MKPSLDDAREMMQSHDVGAEVEIRGMDPWGLRRVERLLKTVEGVDSLKIVPNGDGGIDEIHVLSGSELGAKQIVRNIESALLAQFGLQVDHRKISIAQVRESQLPTEPAHEPEPPSEDAAEPAPFGRDLLLKSFQLERRAGERVVCRVELDEGGEDSIRGEAEGHDYAKSRLEVAAHAILNALSNLKGERASLALEGISEVELFGRRMVVAVVQGFSGRQATALPGISRVHDSVEEAAVLACLHATNRWMQQD